MATLTGTPEVPQQPPQPDPMQQWLAERRTFIGGSEAYKLLNEPYYGKGCVRELAYEKSNLDPDYPEMAPDEDLRLTLSRGTILEPIVAALYQAETGRKLRRGPSNEYGLPRVERHPDYPGAGVHVDRTILAGLGGVTETGDAEIKTHNEGVFLNVLRKGPSIAHVLQLAWANFVKRHSWGSMIILGVFGGLPLRHYDQQADPGMRDMLARECDLFWNTIIQGKLPDPPFPADDPRCKVCPYRLSCRGEQLDAGEAAKIKAAKAGKQVFEIVNNRELAQKLAERELIKAELRALDSDNEEHPGTLQLIEQDIISALAHTPAAIVNGQFKVYTKDGMAYYLDQQRLKAEQPETYRKYFIDGKPTGRKTLRIYDLAK